MLRNYVHVNSTWHLDELGDAYGEVVAAREEFLAVIYIWWAEYMYERLVWRIPERNN